MSENRAKPDQYQLRFPPKMRERLKYAADRNGRSMNAEIIERLDQSFKGWPKVNLPEDVYERVRNARLDTRRELEKEVHAVVLQAVDKHLPAAGALHRDLLENFYKLLSKAPEDQQEALKAEFSDLWLKLATVTGSGKHDEHTEAGVDNPEG